MSEIRGFDYIVSARIVLSDPFEDLGNEITATEIRWDYDGEMGFFCTAGGIEDVFIPIKRVVYMVAKRTNEDE